MAKALGDVKVRRLGRQLILNIPVDVVSALGLRQGMSFRILSRSSEELVLELGEGPIHVLQAGKSALRLAIDTALAPFKEGDRVLVMSKDDTTLVLQRIDYHIVKVSKKERSYYRVNIPWELVEEIGLHKYDAVKVRARNGEIIIEPFEY